uniref:Uncharacterized protein n=1 Tax=Physcomitrium patens TaxID=3218 RepID=A0A2K1JDJ0_PHYPA|nr:hypothetical protein PHYPA_019871 [Physcomitrium patens]
MMSTNFLQAACFRQAISCASRIKAFGIPDNQDIINNNCIVHLLVGKIDLYFIATLKLKSIYANHCRHY